MLVFCSGCLVLFSGSIVWLLYSGSSDPPPYTVPYGRHTENLGVSAKLWALLGQ